MARTLSNEMRVPHTSGLRVGLLTPLFSGIYAPTGSIVMAGCKPPTRRSDAWGTHAQPARDFVEIGRRLINRGSDANEQEEKTTPFTKNVKDAAPTNLKSKAAPQAVGNSLQEGGPSVSTYCEEACCFGVAAGTNLWLIRTDRSNPRNSSRISE